MSRARTLRPCLDCGNPTFNTRCLPCNSARNRRIDADPARKARKQALYGGEWPRIRAAALKSQPWCSLCSTTVDLTVDHVRPGSLDSGVQVLCRPCNSRKSNK